MANPLMIIVGAEKGGVGKTTICRALRAYMDAPPMKDFPRPRMIDGQQPRGDLTRFQPGSIAVNVADIDDQMLIFDKLEGVTILDLPAGALSIALHAADDAMMLDRVREGKIRMALLHVLGPTMSSLDEIADATAIVGTTVQHFIVKNYINETKYFEWDKSSQYARSLQALEHVTINIPHLPTRCAEALQAAQKPISDFIEASDVSETLQGNTKRWLQRCYAGFDHVGLGRMIEETFR